MASENRIDIEPMEVVEIRRRKKTGLFGLLTYSVIVKEDRVGEELHITTMRTPVAVFINGVQYHSVLERKS